MITNCYAIKCVDKYVRFKEYGEFVEVTLCEINTYNFNEVCLHSKEICDKLLVYISNAINNDNEYGMYDTSAITKLDYYRMERVKLEVNFNFKEI